MKKNRSNIALACITLGFIIAIFINLHGGWVIAMMAVFVAKKEDRLALGLGTLAFICAGVAMYYLFWVLLLISISVWSISRGIKTEETQIANAKP